MIVGTAGHIDHGKSALVRALTGRAMDRLAEERRRGITIELGFAPLDLGGGVTAGVVDVPGHEDFVRTMVAGASGLDVALLVIAADDGIMPQTREHLLVLEQLRVPRGIPVVTKADVADPEWVALLLEDVAAQLAGSAVRFGAPIAASARTGQGIDALRDALRALAGETTARREDDLFRLPVDRAFSVPGAGTVVTGTAWSGTVRPGDRVLVLPEGREARVRSVESFGVACERSAPGARVALGLAGVEREWVERGTVLVSPDAGWTVATRLDALLELAPGASPLRDRGRVRVHLGTASALARVALHGTVADGRIIARLRLEAPLVARGGDRLVLRAFSPVTTIGGGEVLDPSPPPRSARSLVTVAEAVGAERLAALVGRRPMGMAREAVPVLAGAMPDDAAALRSAAGAVEAAGHLVAASRLDQLAARLIAEVAAHHAAHPSEPGPSVETLRRGLRVPEWLAQAALDHALHRRRLRVAEGAAALRSFTPAPRVEEAIVERVVARVREGGLAPPSWDELAAVVGAAATPALREAVRRGLLVAVERDRAYHPEALAAFVEAVRAAGASGDLSPGALRDRTGLSRKFLIPLLEWCDRQRITVRAGEGRRLDRPATSRHV